MKYIKMFMNVFGFITGNVLNVAIVALTIYFVYAFAIKGFSYGKAFVDLETSDKPYKEVVVVIPEDADALMIGKILKESNLTENEYFFYLQARLNGTYKYFKPGTYMLNENMPLADVMDALQKEVYVETSNDIKITFPEGLTLKQIADVLEGKELFTAEEFLTVCEEIDLSTTFLYAVEDREKLLEGYLFPDTYFFLKNATPEQVIWKMLDRFEEIYNENIAYLADEQGLIMDDVVKIASIIEREIVRTEERELASAVIKNRMEINMPLQMCSTVMYLLDKKKDRLLYEDLEIESPYNTYINTGLPKGPISSPGLSSMLAAVSPADVDYLYFVLKGDDTSEHFFTKSFSDFEQARKQYNQRF